MLETVDVLSVETVRKQNKSNQNSFGKSLISGKVQFETTDHKPTLPSEHERINRMGGYVFKGPFGDCARVYGSKGQ